MANSEKTFKYTYRAPTIDERKEVESIRKQYLPETKQEQNISKLIKLDRKVKTVPQVIALTIGIVGILVFGLGLTMVLEWNLTIFGVIVGIVGAVFMSVNYFIYKAIYNKFKNKYGEEIIKLSEEILNDDKNKDA